MSSPSPLRAIPSVERLLQSLGPLDVPRPVAAAVVRRELVALRTGAKTAPVPDFDAVLARVRAAVDRLRAARLQPVINGTGILIHTNLGRAPLSDAALEAVAALGADYNNLEYDLAAGERGRSRAGYLEHNLALLCGTQAAAVVNNCAAALVLMLRYFVRREERKEVVISRGELVQIGGGFRVPEILEASGARLREVGTTNRTTLADYEGVLGPQTALVLRVHRSNFYLGGFEESPDPAALAALARRKRVPLAEDLGSGAMVPTERLAAIEHERTPAEAVRFRRGRGVFQRGQTLRRSAGGDHRRTRAAGRGVQDRAIFPGRCVATSSCSARSRLRPICICPASTKRQSPALALMRVSLDALHARAERILTALADLPLAVRTGSARAKIGGGTLPRAELESVTLDFQPPPGVSLAEFAATLRAGTPPVVGYVSGDRFRLDLRTVFLSPRRNPRLCASSCRYGGPIQTALGIIRPFFR